MLLHVSSACQQGEEELGKGAPQRTPRQRVSLVSPHRGSIGKVVPEPLLVELARSFSLQSVPPKGIQLAM